MPHKIRTVDLNSGQIKQLIVSLGDDDKTLLYQLVVNKQNSPTTATSITIDITEQQVELMLKIASHR
jgi:hypothetical protein